MKIGLSALRDGIAWLDGMSLYLCSLRGRIICAPQRYERMEKRYICITWRGLRRP